MKKIIVTGNVGRDPEQRTSSTGESFVTFSLAVSVGTKNAPKTDWLEISCGGKTAEVVQNYVRKGTKLLIEGSPTATAYINKENKPVASLRVYANTIEFIGSREKSEDLGDTYVNVSEMEAQHSPAGFNAPGPVLQSDEVPF